MATNILTQGQSYTDPAGNTGIVNYDTTTGKKLGIGQTTTISPSVITSNAAGKDLNKIQTNLNGISTGIQTQAQNLAAADAAKSEAEQLKQQADNTAKLEADKLALQKVTEQNKAAALGLNTSIPTDATFQGQLNHSTDMIKSVETLPDGSRQVYYKDGSGQLISKDPNYVAPQGSLNAQLIKSQEDYDAEAKKVSDLITNIQNGTVPLNAGQIAQIDGLKQQFNQLIEEQKLVNKGATGVAQIRGYQTGSGEYDPTFQAKTIGSIITAGANKVADLNVKMASAVASLEQGFKSDNISAIKSAWDVYSQAAEKRQETIQKTIENAQKQIEEARKQKEEAEKAYYDQVTKPINDILLEARKNGATDEQLEAIYNSGSVAEAIYNAGDSLQSGSGIVGEYMYYKKQAEAAGQVPMDFNAYQNADANRKKSIAKAGASGGSGSGGAGGIYDLLDYRTANAVIAQGNSFGTSDIVKKYNNIIAASNLIAGVDPNTKNPAEHQAVIYNFAKALDPDSVVREGEYATVKKYSQNLINKYGGEIKQAIAGTGFLSPGAIKAIQEATDNRIKAYEPQYQNLRSETANRINTIAGKDVADMVLLDYDQGYSGNQGLIQSGTQAKQAIDSYVDNNADFTGIETIANFYENGKSDIEIYEWLKLKGLI
jgi:hypothetical protein